MTQGESVHPFFTAGPVVLHPMSPIPPAAQTLNARDEWRSVLVLHTMQACFVCGTPFVLRNECSVFGVQNKGFALCDDCAKPHDFSALDDHLDTACKQNVVRGENARGEI